MNEVIIVKPDKCQGCNACIRACPAPEANVVKVLEDGRMVVNVNPDKCIACGECVRTCVHDARDYIDDTEACMQRLETDKIIILATPSIKSALPRQWKGVLDWFKKKGCLVYDVSFGADICTWAHLRAIESKQVGNVISQPCAAIVRYIETYQPKLLQNISPIHSPILCSATYIRKYQRRTNPIAVLSPCIAKKMEFTDTGLVDYNVTIKKLMEYFDKNEIRIPAAPVTDFDYDFDDTQGQLGGIYPRPGGLKDCLLAHDPDLNIVTAEGVQSVYGQLDTYAAIGDNKHPQVFDVLSCEFGCNSGPGTGTKQNNFDMLAVMKQVRDNAESKRKGGGLFGRGEDRLFKQFDDELQLQDFIRHYKPGVMSVIPNDNQLEEVYIRMCKDTPEKRKHDCHACGYKSCRDMAIAIYRGINIPENCIVHEHDVLQTSSTELSVDNTRLAEITSDCIDISEKLKSNVSEINENMEVIKGSNSKTSTRATEVNDLLQSVIEFCNANSTMDEESVTQLVEILATTQKAFKSLDKNVTRTNESSEAINESIVRIGGLVDEIKTVLART